MPASEFLNSITRRQLLGYLGVSLAVAVPALTPASPASSVEKPGGRAQAAPSVKTFVVSF